MQTKMNCNMSGIFNRILVVAALAASAALSSSCYQWAKEKDEIESDFSEGSWVPEVTIDRNVEVYQYEKRVVVTATFKGVSKKLKGLEIGFMTSTEQDFSSSESVMLKPANGTFSASLPVTPGTVNWVVAMAATEDGASYSEKIAVEVPDVPWYYKIPTSYIGTYTSEASGTTYSNHQLYLEVNTGLQTATIYNFDPYVAKNSAGYKVEDRKTNYITGELDVDNRKIIFRPSGQFYSLGDATFDFAPVSSFDGNSINLGSSFEIEISEDASELVIPWYCVHNQSTGYVVEIYDSEVTLKAN